MTLIDISRLLKMARVPRSKVVQWHAPKPGIVIHVDAPYLAMMSDVVNRMAFKTDNIKVTVLDSREIVQGEHAYVKVTGQTEWKHDPFRSKTSNAIARRAHHANVVVEFHSVVN